MLFCVFYKLTIYNVGFLFSSSINQYFLKTDRESCGKSKTFFVLNLKMDMWLTGISAITTLCYLLSTNHRISNFHTNAPRIQMCNRAVFIWCVLNENVISTNIRGFAVSFSNSNNRCIFITIKYFDNDSISRS